MIYESRKLNPSKIWVLFLLFGWSYGSMGKIGIQFLYWLTLGGFGIWAIIRLFTLSEKIKQHNKKIAIQIGFSDSDLIKLGLI